MPTEEERTAAMLAHGSILLNLVTGVGGVIAAFVIWLIYREKSSWGRFQTLQALVYQVVALAAVTMSWILTFVLMPICLGFLLVPFAAALSLGVMIYGLVAAYHTYRGSDFRYWMIGDFLAEPETPGSGV